VVILVVIVAMLVAHRGRVTQEPVAPLVPAVDYAAGVRRRCRRDGRWFRAACQAEAAHVSGLFDTGLPG
jgi:hypothetical protein